MTDIKERLLERMRDRSVDYTDYLIHMMSHEEIKRLNDALKFEQNRTGRVGTHSPGCWGWGHNHYDCALKEMKVLRDEVSKLEAAAFMKPSPEKMLSPTEAYKFIGLSRPGFYKNVKKGHLPQPYYITPGTPRWRLSELQAAKEGRWK
jgi:predicted DNA-binding transcriptional regulator AlpA